MNKLCIGDVERISGGKLTLKGDASEVKGFSIDSRSIKPGDIFIAVKGHNFDGHDFIEEAFLKGASAVIAQKSSFSAANTGGKGLIIVDDTIEAMSKIAGSLRKTAGIPVVCITGTNGKTTVKDLLASALSSRYNVLKSKASYNNVFGVSLTLFGIKSSHQAAVLELGTNSPGEIGYLAGVAAPDIAVITNIGCGHLEALGDENGVFREKTSLLEKLSAFGTAFLNGDDVMLSTVSKDARNIRFFGTGDNCDLKISEITRMPSGIEFFLNGEKFSVPGYGRHNVYNAAAAAAVAMEMGVNAEEIREKIKKTVMPEMRLEKVVSGGITFLNDAYNANPGSFEAALDALAEFPGQGEKWVVAGDMLELGDASCEIHRSLGEEISSSGIDFLITLGDLGKHVSAGARDQGMREDRTYMAFSFTDAALKIKERAPSGTTVLVKGSRRMKMEEIIKCFTTYCTP